MIAAPTAAAGWIQDQLVALQRGSELVRSIPLDALLGEDYTSPWSLGIAQQTYAEAIGAAAAESARFMAALVIPLAPAEVLQAGAPDLQALDVNPFEPPALYLFERSFFARFNSFEEYRIPVAVPWPESAQGNVYAYYSCYRYPAAQVNDWDYSRAIWFQHFPAA